MIFLDLRWHHDVFGAADSWAGLDILRLTIICGVWKEEAKLRNLVEIQTD
jgi:hypothetical protein